MANTHDKVLKVLRMADYLSPRYQVVVANPPYMGSKGMNARLGAWLKENYEPVKMTSFRALSCAIRTWRAPNGAAWFHDAVRLDVHLFS